MRSASRRGFLRLSNVLPTSRVFTSGYVNTETILHFFINLKFTNRHFICISYHDNAKFHCSESYAWRYLTTWQQYKITFRFPSWGARLEAHYVTELNHIFPQLKEKKERREATYNIKKGVVSHLN